MSYSVERVEQFVEKVRHRLCGSEIIQFWGRLLYRDLMPYLHVHGEIHMLFNEFSKMDRWEKANVLYRLQDDILRIHKKGFDSYVSAARKGDEE